MTYPVCEGEMARLLRVCSLLFLMGLQTLSAWSQDQLSWQRSDGPYGAAFRTFFVDPATGDLWAGTAGDGVYHSTDGGKE